MKKALITGVTGMIGSHLAEYILAKHKVWSVYGLKRWRSDCTNVEDVKNRTQFIDCDQRASGRITDVIAQVKPHHIFHLAAQHEPSLR